MPRRNARICNYPGCLELAYQGPKCDEHGDKARIETIKKRQLYGSRRWIKGRDKFLYGNPTCVRCGGKSQIVDHKMLHSGNEDIFWNEDNWQAMCRSCHGKKTREDDM